MTGFRSRGDPLVNAAFEVTDVRVLDPLYPTSSRVWGASARPNARLTPRQLARTFMPRNRPPPDYARPNSYVLVLPRPTETFIRPGSSPGRR